MTRVGRATQGGYGYHVVKRGNGRRAVVRKDVHLDAFVSLLNQSKLKPS